MPVGFQNEEVYRRFNKRYFYFKYEGGLKSHMTFGQIQVFVLEHPSDIDDTTECTTPKT